jgi:hypothetical protein
MPKYFRQSTTVLLLGSYVALGVVGHLAVLRLLGFGTTPWYSMQTKPGPPPAAKVYWTQYKHIPSNVRIAVPSPAIATRPEVFHHLQIHVIVPSSGFICRYRSPIALIHIPRAPPQA